MIRNIKLAVLAVAAIFGAFLAYNGRKAEAQTQGPTIGQQFKNIKVLNDAPADQLGKIMNLFSSSLGVDCSFCHNTKDYSSDEKREKQTARKMIQMTMGINKDSFNGRTQVTCNTCHNGHEHPTSAPTLWPAAEAAEVKQPDPKPVADAIVAKYQSAIGTKEKAAKITSRYMVATRVEPDGKTEPEEIWQQGRKFRILTTYPTAVITSGFDGTNAWAVSSNGPLHLNADDLAQNKRRTLLMNNLDLGAVYAKFEYRFTDEIDGRPIYLVTATTADNQVDRLYFDVASGLLVRRASTLRTFLGPFVYQWDYSDYKDFGGVKIPTTIKFAQPGVRFTRKITKVKLNAPIADSSVFNEQKK